jgi:hypothetical protein
VFDELQVTREVASLTLPSLYWAEAVNCWVVETLTVSLVGEIETDRNSGTNCCTFSVAVAAGEPAAVAVIVVVPGARALATPLTPIVATAVFDEPQVTREVMSLTLPSLYSAEAVNCWVVETLTVSLVGEIETDRNPGTLVPQAPKAKMHTNAVANNAN